MNPRKFCCFLSILPGLMTIELLLDPVYAGEKNWFVSVVQPEIILNFKKAGLVPPTYLQYPVENIQIGDNPVLVFFKLKNRKD